MIKYYPLTQIRQNLYTRGTEFRLPNGKPYAGRYYLTYDGNAYTGINPVLGNNELLIKVEPTFPLQAGPAPSDSYVVATSQNTQSRPTKANTQLTELTNYFPEPLSSDYARGYFTRYFAKNVTGPGYILEISQDDWSKIENGDVSPTVLGYQSMNMLWQLTGPLNDKRISQYQIQGGIIETNTRVTAAKNKGFNGIIAYIGGEYTKYSKPTP